MERRPPMTLAEPERSPEASRPHGPRPQPAPPSAAAPSVISLFNGALGLDLGLERAGFKIRVAVESDPVANRTIRANRPDLPLLDKPIEEISTEELLDAAELKAGEPTLLAGGPACQAFSTAGKRRSLDDPLGLLFYEYMRVVDEARPRFFLMENVRGLLSAAVRHRPLRCRGPKHPPLEPDEELGSAFEKMTEQLRQSGYYVLFDVLNSADFGTVQTRQRLVLLGSHDGVKLSMPPFPQWRPHPKVADMEDAASRTARLARR